MFWSLLKVVLALVASVSACVTLRFWNVWVEVLKSSDTVTLPHLATTAALE